MEIILLESLNKIGKAGEIVKVKDGFARNFLIPQKKALVASRRGLRPGVAQHPNVDPEEGLDGACV